MVSNDIDVNIISKVDMTDLQRAEIEADKVMSKMQRVISFVKSNVNKISRTIANITSLMVGVLRQAGIMLTPVQEAVVGTFQVVLTSIIQMQSMLAAGTGGMSTAVTVLMVSTALGLSVTGIYAATQQMDEIRTKLSAAEGTIQSLLSTATIWM